MSLLSRPLLASVSLAATLALTSCVPAAPKNDEFKRFNPDSTVMGRVQEAGMLKTGLPVDRPAFAIASSACSSSAPCDGVEGFAFELAQEVADALRVDLEVYAVPNDELIPLVEDEMVDLAFPMVPITESLVRKHSFTDPFLVGHQRIMVPEDIAAPEEFVLEDLATTESSSEAADRVCEYVFPEVGVPVAELDLGLEVQQVEEPQACGALFLKGEIAGAVGHDLPLAGIIPFLAGTCGEGGCPGVPPLPRFVGDQLSTEGYGALVPSGESAWNDFVTQVIEESQQEGRWTALYERWLQPLLGGEIPTPPGMSVEEAAALFPADL